MLYQGVLVLPRKHREGSQDVEENLELFGGHDLEAMGDIAQEMDLPQRWEEWAHPMGLCLWRVMWSL